ncbi:alpha/beta fold hydrolase [Chloroflexota bacterium]
MGDAVLMLHERIANSELITVAGAGHSPHWEEPEFFNEKLTYFLSKVNW